MPFLHLLKKERKKKEEWQQLISFHSSWVWPKENLIPWLMELSLLLNITFPSESNHISNICEK